VEVPVVPAPPVPRPKDAREALALGDQLLAAERYREAIGAFNRVLELNPAHADAHRKLGDALARLGELDAAALHYKSYLALRPGAPDAVDVRKILRELAR